MTNERTEAKIEEMRVELMNDLFTAMQDPDAILHPPEPEPEPEEEAFHVDVPAGEGEPTRYDATHLSRSKSKNIAMLGFTCSQIAGGALDDDERASALRFGHAILDSL